jgi:hypothetical protein
MRALRQQPVSTANKSIEKYEVVSFHILVGCRGKIFLAGIWFFQRKLQNHRTVSNEWSNYFLKKIAQG